MFVKYKNFKNNRIKTTLYICLTLVSIIIFCLSSKIIFKEEQKILHTEINQIYNAANLGNYKIISETYFEDNKAIVLDIKTDDSEIINKLKINYEIKLKNNADLKDNIVVNEIMKDNQHLVLEIANVPKTFNTFKLIMNYQIDTLDSTKKAVQNLKDSETNINKSVNTVVIYGNKLKMLNEKEMPSIKDIKFIAIDNDITDQFTLLDLNNKNIEDNNNLIKNLQIEAQQLEDSKEYATSKEKEDISSKIKAIQTQIIDIEKNNNEIVETIQSIKNKIYLLQQKQEEIK